MPRTDQERHAVPCQQEILRLPPSVGLDRVTRLASRLLDVDMAAVALIDDTCQWHRSTLGAVPPMTPRAGSPCAATARASTALAFPDLQAEPGFRQGLLAANQVRFYAAAPLRFMGRAIGTLSVMSPAVRHATELELGLLEDLAALAVTEIELRLTGGRIDPLSGLPNRTQFLQELEDLGRTKPGRVRLLALIDIARPDELAHMLQAVGSESLDDMLRRDATNLRRTLLRNTIGPEGRLFHVATTQFALLAAPGTEPSGFASRLQDDIRACDLGASTLLATTCTTGLALVTPGEAPPADLLRRAHAALDDARGRRATLGMYSAAHDEALRRAFTILRDFPVALDRTLGDAGSEDGGGPGSLRLVYQPRLDLGNGRCVGVEALLRWSHPALGEVPPGEFVPLIEKTSVARAMMRWVLGTGVRQLRRWREAGILLKLSVNVSPTNLEEYDFAEHVLDTIAAAGLPCTAVELEVTESALLDETSSALTQLRLLSAAGVSVAIDDFGTGYSSLSYLQRLPADVVKIDQSFIRGLSQGGTEEARCRTLVLAMIALSHDLGYRVVAEGIETAPTAGILTDMGCDEVQGYHFARPMPAAALAGWLDQRPWTPEPGRIAGRLPLEALPLVSLGAA